MSSEQWLLLEGRVPQGAILLCLDRLSIAVHLVESNSMSSVSGDIWPGIKSALFAKDRSKSEILLYLEVFSIFQYLCDSSKECDNLRVFNAKILSGSYLRESSASR